MIGNKIISLAETASTNKYATELIKNNTAIEDGTIVLTHHQTAGRGTGDNHWESEKGKNLTLSIISFPTFLPIEKQFMMNKVVSLAVFDMVCILTKGKETEKIKWPNDIYAGNKKIAGITSLANTSQRCCTKVSFLISSLEKRLLLVGLSILEPVRTR